MRDLYEYPVTKAEVLAALDDLEKRQYGLPESIGGLTGYILNRLAKVVERDFNPEDYAIKIKEK